jgi:imidazolonepropionase
MQFAASPANWIKLIFYEPDAGKYLSWGMSSRLIVNGRQLVNTRAETSLLRGPSLADLPFIQNAWLLLEEDEIAAYGPMSALPPKLAAQWRKAGRSDGILAHDGDKAGRQVIDATGQFILPAWCDSHTHLVFSGSREEEFVDKIRGLSYADIHAKGGGILNSARKLNETSEEALFVSSWKRLEELSRLGTGAVEIKSGYGLNVEGELKMLRVIKRLKERSALTIKASFLGAHAYPPEYKDNHPAYIDLIVNEMLPVIARDRLADYIDVFCEKGFFDPDETEMICRAGMGYGLKPKIHANQLYVSGGVEVGVKLGALSVDHLESLDDSAIRALARSNTIGTLLPTAAFFLGLPFQPARALIDAGCAIALASDFNPGSSPSGNMNLVVAMSCIQMRLLPEEAINAATLNGAYAMELGNELGSITPGKKANLIFTKPIPSLAYLPYAFGSNLIDKVMIKGEFVHIPEEVFDRSI